MSRQVWLAIGCVMTVAVTVSGCSNPQRLLGIEKKAPDEFAVVPRAPLVLPPEYSLSVPDPGGRGPQDGLARKQAQNALLGVSGVIGGDQDGPLTTGESALIKDAGADRMPEGIRTVVNQEASFLAEEEELPFTERLVFWRDSVPPGTIVDAPAEAQRLKENLAQGKPVTEGETPKIKPRQKALLEGLF